MIKYVPNRAGLQDLLRGEVAQELVQKHTNHQQSLAGDGFEASYQQGASRYRGIVYPATWSAIGRNRRDNILIRNLG